MTGEPGVHSAWVAADGSAGSAGSATSLFPWWSFTKTVLAIAALRLVDQGRLDLDTPRPGRPYTLRQLLQHRAGVADYASLDSYREAVAANEAAWPRDRMLAEAGGERLVFLPDTGWAYSNIGYMFVGDAIEQASRLPLAAALSELLFDPLSLPAVRLAALPGDFRGVHWPELRGYDPRWVYHGCLVGTAVDAARLLQSLFSERLLQPGTLNEMTKAHPLGGALPGRPWTSCGYGLGVMSGEVGEAGRAVGHTGSGPFGANAVYHFPDLASPVTVASFSRGSDEGPAEHKAVAIALDQAR